MLISGCDILTDPAPRIRAQLLLLRDCAHRDGGRWSSGRL